MSKNNGGPAFPYVETGECGERPGMTLRDYFAAKAMSGLIGDTPEMMKDIAESAYEQADAMLAEREKGGE